VANQFAAMPSLHFGWAVLVAVGFIRVARTPWRWLWIAHPIITLLVIVGTGNHYWLDAAVAGALIIGTERVINAWNTTGSGLRPVGISSAWLTITPVSRWSAVLASAPTQAHRSNRLAKHSPGRVDGITIIRRARLT
jgi:PAP2 superfamily protein